MAKFLISPNILWRVENYESTDKKLSPAVILKGLEWKLKFFQFKKDYDEMICLTLECLNSSDTSAESRFFAVAGIPSFYNNKVDLRTAANYSLKDKEWCIWEDSISNIKKKKGSDKHIDFLVKITYAGYFDELCRIQKSVEVNHVSPCIRNLIEDFGKLFNDGKSCDFVLKCGEKSFSVHKAVLSARSAFFEGMFRSDMKETNDGIGKIENLEPEILELLLRYMYTGESPVLSMESLHEVYAAADRFAVESLQVKCHTLLIESYITSSEENSDEGTEEELKNKQTQVCQTKLDEANEKQLLKELFMTREWRLFSKEFPRKSQEMCKTLIQK